MVNSKLNKLNNHFALLRLLYAALLGLLLAGALPAATIESSTADINIESDGTEVDALTKQTVWPKVRIWQEGYEIQADEARAKGLDFSDSQWTFTGKVRITTPQGSSTADRAVVNFVQSQITEVHISGKPATFEQRDTSKQLLAQGEAGSIDYYLQKNTVRLSSNAWIKYGRNDCHATAVLYNIIEKNLSAASADQDGQRIKCTIVPSDDGKP